ncbi:MAG: beta-ketoacyl synthase chain length factor [Salinivirgaceae bacterium]|nr:beta-ketoacyl synthase chain length factor [Salinivirgaceae bacterium]
MKPVYITRTCQIANDQLVMDGVEAVLDYKEIIADPALRRRMSRIVKMGVACGLKCIEELAPESIDAIITATGFGCLADTEKFIESIVANSERLLNPTPFIQSTFNTIGGQIALLRGIHSYNVTYAHRGLSFESALIDAAMQVAEGKKNVLLGAIDEITASSADIQRRLGMTREYELGEGANFFVLNATTSVKDQPAVFDIDTRSGKQTEDNLVEWIVEMADRNNIKTSDLWIIFINSLSDIKNNIKEKLGPNNNIMGYKSLIYPTFTASVLDYAINMLMGLTKMKILLVTEYQHINYSLILLGRG